MSAQYWFDMNYTLYCIFHVVVLNSRAWQGYLQKGRFNRLVKYITVYPFFLIEEKSALQLYTRQNETKCSFQRDQANLIWVQIF